MTAKAKILLIDDEALVREELGALLQDEGYEVITGADGEEGLALFRVVSPDMVITDVRMPRRDGLSVAMTIREEDPSVPVTVITGHGTESMAIEALRAGVNDFIKKPVRLDDLTAALQRMQASRQPLGFTELPPSVELVEHSWTYRLGNDLEVIPVFVDALLKRAAVGMDRTAVLELGLALRETILNAVEHGNLGLSYKEKSQALENGTLDDLLRERGQMLELEHRRVTVCARREDRCLTVQIIDEGEGFEWRELPDPTDTVNLLSTHGRGVLLARLSVDSLTYNERGNGVTIVKRF
jgi:CheY-like chemotaxis protein/anti-sigma regulatory factor (Ser/Thr protein kinase)